MVATTSILTLLFGMTFIGIGASNLMENVVKFMFTLALPSGTSDHSALAEANVKPQALYTYVHPY